MTQNPHPNPSIVIAGAGPVGLFVALLLVKAGIPVTVLEKLDGLDLGPKCIAQSPPVFPAFKQAGIWEEVNEASGNLADAGIVFRKTSTKEIIAEVPHPPGRPVALILSQNELSRILLRNVQKFDLAKVLFGHEVVDVDTSASDSATVIAKTADGQEKRFTGTYVLGVDGSKSRVRHALKVPFEGKQMPQQQVASNVRYPFEKHGFIKGANFMADPVYYGIVAPINDEGLWRVGFGISNDFETKEEVDKAVPEIFDAMFPGPKPLKYEIERLAPYKALQLCVDKMKLGRVLLLGDAAHCKWFLYLYSQIYPSYGLYIHCCIFPQTNPLVFCLPIFQLVTNPFAGMGLNSGLLDASALGPILVSHLLRGAPESLLEAWAVARKQAYHKIVDPVSQAAFWAMQDPDVDSIAQRHPFLKAALGGGPPPPSLATDWTKLEGWVA